MKMTRQRFPGLRPVDSYGPGFFRIEGQVHYGPIIVLPAGVTEWTDRESTGQICEQSDHIDVLIVGTGAEMTPVSPEFRLGLIDCGIAVEDMPTPSACRTFNVLLAEGRNIAVALMPV